MYDVIILNGTIYDGTGKDAYQADLAINGDRIAKIGDLKSEEASRKIDAKGKCVVPGFIEPHSHCDLSVLFWPQMTSYLQQGVTTTVGGNCGHSFGPVGDELYRAAIVDSKVGFEVAKEYFSTVTLLMPKAPAVEALKKEYGIDMDWHSFGEYIDRCNEAGMCANIVPLVGYSAIRGTIMGLDCCREASEEELDQIEDLVRKCMEEGAFGMSTGTDPQYLPGPFATKEETIRMLKVVAEYDGIFSSHTRNYDMAKGIPDRMGGYHDMLEEALSAGVRANVSHVHTLGMGVDDASNAKAAEETLAYFEEMAAKGLDLSYDVIPSPFSMDLTVPYFATFLRPFVLWCGGRKQFAKHLESQDTRKMVHAIVDAGLYPYLDSKNLMTSIYPLLVVSRHKNHPEAIGMNLLAYAQSIEKDPLDAALDLFISDPDMGTDMALPDAQTSNEILCRHEMAMPCADGFSGDKDTNFGINEDLGMLSNPMNLSCMIRWLNLHGKKRFEDSIRQITSFPAQRFAIADRGVLEEGKFADIVILDKDGLVSHDRDEDPLQYPEGIDYVFVNGQLSIDHKKQIEGVKAGRMLRKGR